MRISDIKYWLECEHSALHGTPDVQDHDLPAQSAAQWVGQLAHHNLYVLLSGDTLLAPPELPDRLVYDRLTTTPAVAEVQARQIAHEAKRLIDNNRLSFVDGEQPVSYKNSHGRYDLLLRWNDGYALVDLKTGRTLPAHGWLQLGGYASALNQDTLDSVGLLGLLHVPRVSITNPIRGTLELRGCQRIVGHWESYSERILQITSGETIPIKRPGVHCPRCSQSDVCPVAMLPAKLAPATDRRADAPPPAKRGPTLDEWVDALRRADCEPEQRGDGSWRSKCPAHQDDTPSLSIKAGDGTPVLVKCFAGCEFKAVAAALDLPRCKSAKLTTPTTTAN